MQHDDMGNADHDMSVGGIGGGDTSSGGTISPATARTMRLERFALALAHSQEELKRVMVEPPQPRSLLQLNLKRELSYGRLPTRLISNMPLIETANESMIIINNSPFALTDRRFGILHHCTMSDSYV
uniref:Uncharacterized protein n=1 Tax=Anopheles maculatus TaxID=74869 RepID=A0A182TA56_9DIPT